MKKYLIPIFWIIILAGGIYMSYEVLAEIFKTAEQQQFSLILKGMTYMLISGAALSALIYDMLYSHTTESLNQYKRELEKESIGSNESSSKIKVLEAKIEVLEKALDEALKKS